MKAAIGSGVGKMVGAYIGGTPLAKVCHGSVQLWPDDLWKVSVLRFASDVRTAAMTHAIWRGSVSFDIGGVSYVHGRNMQIADDGMSLAFTGEDKPTCRDVNAALGESMVLNATLRGSQQDISGFSAIGQSFYQKEIYYPVAPCYIVVNGRGSTGMLSDKACIAAAISDSVDTERNVFFSETVNLAGGEYREQWFDCNLWHVCNKMVADAFAIGDIYGVYLRFKEFSYAKQYNVIGIE